MSACPPFLLPSTGKYTQLYLSPKGAKSKARVTGSMHPAQFSMTVQPCQAERGEIAGHHDTSWCLSSSRYPSCVSQNLLCLSGLGAFSLLVIADLPSCAGLEAQRQGLGKLSVKGMRSGLRKAGVHH